MGHFIISVGGLYIWIFLQEIAELLDKLIML